MAEAQENQNVEEQEEITNNKSILKSHTDQTTFNKKNVNDTNINKYELELIMNCPWIKGFEGVYIKIKGIQDNKKMDNSLRDDKKYYNDNFFHDDIERKGLCPKLEFIRLTRDPGMV